jgi:hypothetical protein
MQMFLQGTDEDPRGNICSFLLGKLKTRGSAAAHERQHLAF